MKKQTWLCLLLVLALFLSGCGSVAKDANRMESMDASATESAQYNPLESDSLTAGTVVSDRKWIITVDMCAETEDLDAFLEGLNGHIEELEGYVESSNVYHGSAYASSRYRNASLTIRIPAQRVDSFAQQVSAYANVTSSNQDKQDITLTYVSVESRMKALQAEESRLLELMEQAETMADLLEIEERLTQVRYELENVTSQLRVYDDRVDYATIYLYVSEVREYTVVEEQTVWQRITSGFLSSLKGVANFCVELFVFLLANAPYLVVVAVTIWVLSLLCRRMLRRRKAKNQPPQ